uniref:GAF domain-containing protein n=1 Tax=Octactis speculum TaxID=3111310 RepID=A0A7S2MFV9_9STRA
MSTEEVADFVERTNFKNIVEWLTAESILHRPEDPIVFCRNLLSQKIAARGDSPFDAAQPTEYLKSCYEEAGTGEAKNYMVDTGALATMETRIKKLEQLLEASKAIANCLDPYEATTVIIKESLDILSADRASLWTVTEDGKNLKLMVAEGVENLTVPVGVGIAGGVAKSKVPVNITDAYSDERFDKSYDKESGYVTKTMLCEPIIAASGEVVGVMQVLNKSGGVPFNAQDEEHARLVTAQAGVALKNAQIFRSQMLMQKKLRSVTDLIKALQENMGINSLIFTMTTKAPLLTDADRCSIFIVDGKANALTSLQGEVNISISLDKASIATSVANSGTLINIPEAYSDERFNQAVDKASGYTTKTILCMPIKAKGTVVGVIQLINKADGPFDENDEEIMSTFLDLAGPIIMESSIVQAQQKDEETGSEFAGKTVIRTKAAAMPVLEGFAEGSEDEEEDDE